MKITIVSASNKQPAWIRDGFVHYAQRLRGSLKLELKEVPLPRRSSTVDQDRMLVTEGKRMLAQLPETAHVVALVEDGAPLSTKRLAVRLKAWIAGGRPVALLIGGPDGLAPRCIERADEKWSLSALTLPHGVVRVLVAEAIYRAWTLLEGHPYHRG